MSGFSGSPRVVRGALAAVGLSDPLAALVVFQYNPDTITRTVRANAGGREGDGRDVLRLQGPPDETLAFDVEIDAADQLDEGDRDAGALGVYPALSRLELLLYPSAARAIANEALAAVGVVERVPPAAPLTLLVWGHRRAVPVRLQSFTIVEEAFDPALNPVRARVSLDLAVLTYRDLGVRSPGGAVSLAHQIAKEAM